MNLYQITFSDIQVAGQIAQAVRQILQIRIRPRVNPFSFIVQANENAADMLQLLETALVAFRIND